jgi:glycosyltransferase involved in cell wall biosynthesis
MKIAFYTAPSYLDTSIPLINHLAGENDVFLIIEYYIKKAEGVSPVDKFSSRKMLSTDPTEIHNFLGDELSRAIDNRIKIYLLRYISLKSLNPTKYLSLIILIRLLHKLKPDVFDMQCIQSAFVIPFLKKWGRVISIHDPVAHTGEGTLGAELVKKLAVLGADQIIVHSKEAKHNLIKKYNIPAGKVNTLYLGVLDIFKNWVTKQIPEDPNTILFFGRISPYKGIQYLIEAVPLIKKAIPDVKIVIAGNGTFNFDIEHIQADTTYEIINRYIPNNELVDLIQRSTLVVCPYTDATQSGVIMTALAFNKAVVATSVGGIPEIVQDDITGKLVPPRNHAALADAIIDLLINSQKRELIKNNIEIMCSQGNLSWNRIAQQTMEVYSKAIKK